MSTPAYHERLYAPLRWWVQVTMFLATVWLALVVSTPLWLACTTFALVAAISYGLVAWIGSPLVQVHDDVLRAGRARIPVDLLGAAEVLDADATRDRLGLGADARAFLVTRPYLKESVLVPVLDPDDPAPYWLIHTRHPERLAVNLRDHRDHRAPRHLATDRATDDTSPAPGAPAPGSPTA